MHGHVYRSVHVDVDTAVGLLSNPGAGCAAAGFPLPAAAFDSFFAASQWACWLD